MNGQKTHPFQTTDGPCTRLYFCRHGEVHAEDRKSLYGQMDVRLSEHGKEQSRRVGEALKGVKLAAVYTSDLTRAKIAAEEIARHHGLAVIESSALRERHFGHWQGIVFESIQEQFPEDFAAYMADRIGVRVPGGAENFHDVKARVCAFVREIVARHPGEEIALAAHSGPCRMLLCEAFDMPLTSFFNFEQDYCCINVVDYYSNGHMRVRTMNSISHLETLVNV